MVLYQSPFFVLLSATAAARAAFTSDVISLNSSNFDDVVLHSGKMTFVNLYLGYSGHCKAYRPRFEALASRFSHFKDQLQFARLDLHAEQEVLRRFVPNPDYDTSNLPSMRLFGGGSYQSYSIQDLAHFRQIECLAAHITSQTGLSPKRDVVTLTDRTFAEVLGGSKHVLVAYMSSSCQLLSCKRLRLVWETLAAELTHSLPGTVSRNVVIAEVVIDSPHSQVISAMVPKYPIKWYPAGSKTSDDYLGDTSSNDLVKFVRDRADRPDPAETSDYYIGPIPEFDAMLAKVANGEITLESVLQQLHTYTNRCWKGTWLDAVYVYLSIGQSLLPLSLLERKTFVLDERRDLKKFVSLGYDFAMRKLNILNQYAKIFGLADNE